MATNQQILDFNVAHARKSDPETSHQAAAKVVNIGPVREGILELLKDYGPMTDEELIGRYRDRVIIGQLKNATEQSIRSRRAELTRTPFHAVIPCGKKQNSLGNQSQIWRLA